MRKRNAAILTAAAAFIALPGCASKSSTSSTTATSPSVAQTAKALKRAKSLYTALLTTAYPDAQLPSGFSSAKVSLSTPSKQGQKYHVVGEISVAVDGPDPNDGIFYYVFPNVTDAMGDLTNAKPKGNLHIMPGGVPTYPAKSSCMYAGSVTGQNVLGKNVTDGLTAAFVVKGNMIVGSLNTSADNTDSGNVPAALELLKSALRHLAAVKTASK
jgi:hypothetical protein